MRGVRRRDDNSRGQVQNVRVDSSDGSTTRVRNFNDLWVIEVNATGTGRLITHVVFDLALERQRPE